MTIFIEIKLLEKLTNKAKHLSQDLYPNHN